MEKRQFSEMTKRSAAVMTIALFSLLLLMLLCSCEANDQGDVTPENAQASNVPSLSEDELEEGVYSIETSHGNLTFPEKWKDKIRVEQNDVEVSFYGTIGDNEIGLFAIGFGSTPDKGNYLGELNGEEVYVIDMPIEFDDSWNGDDRQVAIEMQDSVNFIIQGLKDRGLAMA